MCACMLCVCMRACRCNCWCIDELLLTDAYFPAPLLSSPPLPTPPPSTPLKSWVATFDAAFLDPSLMSFKSNSIDLSLLERVALRVYRKCRVIQISKPFVIGDREGPTSDHHKFSNRFYNVTLYNMTELTDCKWFVFSQFYQFIIVECFLANDVSYLLLKHCRNNCVSNNVYVCKYW